MKPTNLEIIKSAAKMGYSAILELQADDSDILYDLGTGKVTYCNDIYVQFQHGPDIKWKDVEFDNQWTITGFLYVGHLFGEPEIPEGQKFRVKETGEIFEFKENAPKLPSVVRLETNPQASFLFDKSEIEPVFQ